MRLSESAAQWAFVTETPWGKLDRLTDDFTVQNVQSKAAGFNTGKGEKLSYNQVSSNQSRCLSAS